MKFQEAILQPEVQALIKEHNLQACPTIDPAYLKTENFGDDNIYIHIAEARDEDGVIFTGVYTVEIVRDGLLDPAFEVEHAEDMTNLETVIKVAAAVKDSVIKRLQDNALTIYESYENRSYKQPLTLELLESGKDFV